MLWMASQSSEVLAIGRTSNGINSHDKVTIQTIYSSSRYPRLVLEVEWIWFDRCNWVGDLENAWMMSDHVKRVKRWTTMAAHVYDETYQQVMTISCCDFQSEDKDVQVLFYQNFNHVIAQHGIPHPTFIGFIADSAQANWNIVRIVYEFGDPKVPMEGCERTCFFHWKQSLEKHTKSYIKHELHDQYRHLCLEYRNASSMEEAETRYLAIKLGGRHRIVQVRTVSNTSSSGLLFGIFATFNGVVS